MVLCLVFFFKQKTAYEMRISDWSSDVCSSDLRTLGVRGKYKRTIPWGTLEPRFRIELQRDFHDQSGAAIAYLDLQSAPVYVLPADALDRSRYIIEIGTLFTLSEASRVGTECASQCISRWSPYNQTKK